MNALRWQVPHEEYYPLAETERSWAIYLDVHASYPDAILIGGWASWLHTRAARSHDIDLIVDASCLHDMKEALDLTENYNFGSPKWGGDYDGIHLDVYATYRSRLGTRLQLPVEHLVAHRFDIDGYPTLTKEALLVAKAAARIDRPDTMPGRKDADDMVRMLLDGNDSWDFSRVGRIADCAAPKEGTGSALVLEAIAGLADEERTRGRARQLRELVKLVQETFLEMKPYVL
jgi:hypothetical protein